tara:strand:+ start:821 stop:1042 length:222 start_codon:yes stop_codon:yes gene_type:complete
MSFNQHLGKTNSPEVKKAPSFTMTYKDKMAIAELLIQMDKIINLSIQHTGLKANVRRKLDILNRRAMGYINQR